MKDQATVKREIRAVELAWRKVFSTVKQFDAHLWKWQDDVLYDMYAHNAFVPGEDVPIPDAPGQAGGEPDLQDFERAAAYQKARHLDFLEFDSRKPLKETLLSQLSGIGLDGGATETMYLPEKHPESWKRNPAVVIRDVKQDPIADALKQIELTNNGVRTGMDFTARKMDRYTKMAKENENLHYYGAFLNDEIAGACFAYVKNGYIMVDELIVNEAVRKQYVATTLMAHIAEQFAGTLFLHADPDDTPKNIYAKMGFVAIDTIYEYTAKLKAEIDRREPSARERAR